MIFPTTHWSLLARATLDGNSEGKAALDDLCRRYWRPLNGFIRARGYSSAEADDLTQGFLLHLLEHSALRKPDRLRGRFRSFLLGALVRFLGNERDRRSAQKRGGQVPHVSLEEHGDDRVGAITVQEQAGFDRAWALTVLRACLSAAQVEYVEAGQEKVFSVARKFLPGAGEPPPYEEAAAQAGLSVSAFTSELHRLRRRIRELLWAEVAGTVGAPHEIEEELNHLQKVLMDRGTDLRAAAES
jgi:RNA polymerase sigma-70 factor (ECF subfamily)